MQTVLIAGASRGIGLELVRQYASAGWKVIACCRRPDGASDLRSLAKDPNIDLYELDTGSDRSVADVASVLNGRTIDLVVVTAGVSGGERQGFGSFDFDDLASTLNVNTAGPLRIAQALRSNLKASPNGKAIAITSQMGSIAQTSSTEMLAYRISKAALNEAWKGVSIELRADGVTAMVIHPGWVATDMGGENAPVSPQQSAAGIISVIDNLGIEDAGTFLSWEGQALPW